MSENEWLDIFAENLLELMKEKGYNQINLAESTNLSKGTISSYINKRKVPGIRALVNIAYELNISFDDLMDFGDRID